MATSKEEAKRGATAYARESGGLLGEATKNILKNRADLEEAGGKTESLTKKQAPTTLKVEVKKTPMTYITKDSKTPLSSAARKRLSQ